MLLVFFLETYCNSGMVCGNLGFRKTRLIQIESTYNIQGIKKRPLDYMPVSKGIEDIAGFVLIVS